MRGLLRPGWEVLTWTSMNIERYRDSIQEGLRRLEEVSVKASDIVDNRIEKNLKGISRAILVDMPAVSVEFLASLCRPFSRIEGGCYASRGRADPDGLERAWL